VRAPRQKEVIPVTNLVVTGATMALQTAGPAGQRESVIRAIDTYGSCALALGLFAINPPLGIMVAAGSLFRAGNLAEAPGFAGTVGAAAAGACEAIGFCAIPVEGFLGLPTEVVARNFTSVRGTTAVAA